MDTALNRRAKRANSKSQRGSEESPLVQWTLLVVAETFALIFTPHSLLNIFDMVLV